MAEQAQKGKMSDERLLALIEVAESDALGSPVASGAAVGSAIPADRQMTTLQVDQYNAVNTYYARPMGNEEEGKSSIVLPEMRDIIEWEVPQLLRIFCAGPVCQFDPCGPQDVKPAQLETAAVQHLFMQENPGFLICHDLIKDARMLRNGYVRAMVEKRRTTSLMTFTGLTEMQVAIILSDKADEKIEILEQRPDEIDGPVNLDAQTPDQVRGPPIKVWDLKVRKTKTRECLVVDCMPPEEMLVSARCRDSLDKSEFTQHHSWVPRSDLLECGYDETLVNELPGETEPSTELVPLARMVVVDQLARTDSSDKSMQTVSKRDIVMRVDYDGDGVAELRHIVLGHKTILENEEVDEVAYVGGAATRMPHRHTGLSAFDDLGDIQAIKTDLARGLLDNARLVSNPRVGVDFGNCSMEDLMTMRDGGIIRTKGPPANVLMPFDVPFVGDKIIPIMETVDSWREMRTGVGKDTVGINPDVLQDVTKGAALAGMAAASLKIELKARLLAETIFAPLFRLIHSLIRKHPKILRPFQYQGQWVTLDPSTWDERESVSPAVGLGSGQREEMRQNLMLLGQAQQTVAQMGLVGPKQAYATFSRMCQLLGFNNPSQYAMDPESPEYQQHMMQMQQAQQSMPNPAVQVQQLKNQGQLQLQGAKSQTAAITQNAETQRAMAHLNAQMQRENQDAMHGIMEQGRQHAYDASQADMDRATQTVLALFKILAPIVASQYKQDPSANAGQVLANDARAARGAMQ